MKRCFFLSILIAPVLLFAQTVQLDSFLQTIPDVTFEKIAEPKQFESAYELRVKQPLDHKNPDKGYFMQRVFLSHKSLEKPMVMVTEGYSQSQNRVSEVAALMDANQVVIEHRYCGASVPKRMDYKYLNLEQATADLHRINEIFKKIYKADWISTGISKGGQTTIYYRYFYPNDVVVSIPYVAPLCLELEDKRIYSFLDTVGSDKCREKIRAYQMRMFEHRDEAIDYLRWYALGAQLSFGYLSLDAAYEYALLEYPFMFWQWGGKCYLIPNESATLDEDIVYLLRVMNIDFYSDDEMEKYGSHYYQAATEMGYYGYDIEPFKDYLKALPTDVNPSAVFAPKRSNPKFDGTLANNVYNWLADNGEQFIYIYGGNDTWTATAVPKNDNRDAVWITLEGADHGQARIKNMNKADQRQVLDALNRWVSVDFTPAVNWLK